MEMVVNRSAWPEGIFDVPKKITIIRLRWLAIIICSYLLIFSPRAALSEGFLHAFILFYMMTNFALYWIPEKRFESPHVCWPLVIFDTLALTGSLVVTGQLQSDFYLSYFLIILVCSFWEDSRWLMASVALIISLYGFLLFIAADPGLNLYLRVPFLYVASLFYGYFTRTARTERMQRKKAEEDALRDFLTGIPNRRSLEQRLAEEFENGNRNSQPLSVLLFDVNDFKEVNDSYGHLEGDKVLKKVAEALKNGTRRGDFTGRYAGDEFVIILPQCNLEEAFFVGERICRDLQKLIFRTDDGTYSISASFGASSTSGQERFSTWEQLLRRADQSLYRRKQGRLDRRGPAERAAKPLALH